MATPAIEALRLIQTHLTANSVDEVPEGWLTVREYAQAWGMARCTASAKLAEGVEAGIMERRVFRVPSGGRTAYPIPHFRVKP